MVLDKCSACLDGEGRVSGDVGPHTATRAIVYPMSGSVQQHTSLVRLKPTFAPGQTLDMVVQGPQKRSLFSEKETLMWK